MDPELRSMILELGVKELEDILGFAGKDKSGVKNELQAKVLELIKRKSLPPISMKIKDLYSRSQINLLENPLSNFVNSDPNDNLPVELELLASPNNEPRYSSLYQNTSFGRIQLPGLQYGRTPPYPDITMRELPFYDVLSTLIKPTGLLARGHMPQQEFHHSFCLTPSQAKEISNSRDQIMVNGTPKIYYAVQVQLRFCAMATNEEQDDLFPPGLSVKINGRAVTLPSPIPSPRPGVEPKRPSKPLYLAGSIKCSPFTSNSINVQWLADNTKGYAMTVQIVKRVTADELLQRIKDKGIQPMDFTRARIKEMTTAGKDDLDLCAPTSIRVSVACPLGKSRMTYPCRATTCKHLQCFDASAFLLMNEKKPLFVCPVCNNRVKFDELCIDGYFVDVIQNLINVGNEVVLAADGSWAPAVVKDKAELVDVAPAANDTIDLDDDIIMDEKASSNISKSKRVEQGKIEMEVVDLDLSEED